jgi:hypothetical protein
MVLVRVLMRSIHRHGHLPILNILKGWMPIISTLVRTMVSALQRLHQNQRQNHEVDLLYASILSLRFVLPGILYNTQYLYCINTRKTNLTAPLLSELCFLLAEVWKKWETGFSHWGPQGKVLCPYMGMHFKIQHLFP